MNRCQVKGCRRPADGQVMFQGKEVCAMHEKRHWASDGKYIWERLR